MKNLKNLSDEAAMNADKHRRMWIVTAAIAFPAALLVIGSTGHPEYGFVLIAVVFPVLFLVGQVRGRRSREGTDERARHLHREATSFSWQVTAVVFTAVTAWMNIRYGLRAAEPYVTVTAVLLISYIGSLLWRRWRD